MIHMSREEALNFVFQDFYNTIKERKKESDAELEKADDFEKGKNLAYFEILDIFESRCKIYGVDLEDWQEDAHNSR